jgi:DnaJ-class molecular chaperone
MSKCFYCNGQGEVACEGTSIIIGKYEHPLDCPSCKGNNRIPCPECNGTGIENE